MSPIVDSVIKSETFFYPIKTGVTNAIFGDLGDCLDFFFFPFEIALWFKLRYSSIR